MSHIFDELNRRSVIRVVVGYLAAAWLLVQIADTLFPIYGLSDRALQILTNLLGIGLVPTIVIAWVFELTPEGIKRDSGETSPLKSTKSFDRTVMIVLAVAVGYFAVDKFILDPARDAEIREQATEQGRSEAMVESYGDKSIAVLPFVNMSSDPEQDYFSDGMSEEILNLLAKIRPLRVISRSSAFSYRGEVNIAQVASELGVSYVLEGSVRKAGDRVRITTQLIDARSDTHVWSETFDRMLSDVFTIQDEVANLVARELELQILDPHPEHQKTDPETYALYLRARHMTNAQTFGEDKWPQIKMLEQALARDPKYVPAMTLLSTVLFFAEPNDEYSADYLRQWRRRVTEEAFAIDPDDGVANLQMGMFAFMEDSPAAWKYLGRALELGPNNVEVLRTAGYIAQKYRRLEDAAALFRRAIARERFCLQCYSGLNFTLKDLERYEEAAFVTRQRVALFDDIGGHVHLGWLYLKLGQPEAALKEFEYEPNQYIKKASDAMAYFDLGQQEKVENILEELTTDPKPRPFQMAELYAHMGNYPEALVWMEKYVAEDSERIVYTAWNPDFAPLHDTPQWLGWRKDAGIDDESLARIDFDFGKFTATQ